MASLGRLYSVVVTSALVFVASSCLVFTTVATIYDVIVRNMGFQPPVWTSTITEYAMLLMTMCMAPVLVRSRGHVAIDALVGTFPIHAQRVVAACVATLCTVLCASMSYYATLMALEVAARNELDIRSITVPRWVLFSFLAFGFGLSAVEFARSLVLRKLDTPDSLRQESLS